MSGSLPPDKKSILRKEITARLADVTPEETAAQSRRISETIMDLPQWQRAKVFLAYLPIPGEYDSRHLLEAALARDLFVGVPRLVNRTRNLSLGRNMEFHRIFSLNGPWDTHPYGLKEPQENAPVFFPEKYAKDEIFVLTPGLAFDRHGLRLGRGGGYYDTYIGRFPGQLTLVAPAFTCQIVERVPAEPHDGPVDLIVYPGGIIGDKNR